jgi:hypothetical protein
LKIKWNIHQPLTPEVPLRNGNALTILMPKMAKMKQIVNNTEYGMMPVLRSVKVIARYPISC